MHHTSSPRQVVILGVVWALLEIGLDVQIGTAYCIHWEAWNQHILITKTYTYFYYEGTILWNELNLRISALSFLLTVVILFFFLNHKSIYWCDILRFSVCPQKCIYKYDKHNICWSLFSHFLRWGEYLTPEGIYMLGIYIWLVTVRRQHSDTCQTIGASYFCAQPMRDGVTL